MKGYAMTAAHRRHDISDEVWTLLEPHLPGRKGAWGGRAKDNKRFINAVFWILRTGAPWRDLPPDYGDWKNTHRRFCRWRDAGTWEALLEKLVDDPDFQWLMIDASYLKVHPHAAGAWSAGPSYCYTRYHSRLHAGYQAHGRNKRRVFAGRSRL
jgi:transposase